MVDYHLPLSSHERVEENHRRLEKYLGHTPTIVFSVCTDSASELDVDIESIAIPGRCLLFYEDAYFGNGKQYSSPVLFNPTWLEVCKRAEDAMKYTDDLSHYFLESADCIGSTDDGTRVYSLFIGS